MEVLSGTVDSIVYRSEENGYTIAKIKDDNIIYTIVGEIPHIRERQLLKLSGTWINHPSFGKEFKVEICEEIIPHLTENLWNLKELREDLWMADAKPFGYELIDLRMGGVITRLDSTRRRLHNYMNGKVSRLEELETERIPYFAEGEPAIENHWQRAVSGADFTDTI